MGLAQRKFSDLIGLAAPFNRPTRLSDGRIEMFAPGAFKRAIARGKVICRVDHQGSAPFVIARQSDNALQLWETAAGLCIGMRLDCDPWWCHRLKELARQDRLLGWSVSWRRWNVRA